MEIGLSIDAREVLFHLNYMGYRNVTKEQLKSFMIDLKKLIKYESQPQKSSTEVRFQGGAHLLNVQRLFENHTETSKMKQRDKHSAPQKSHNCPKQQHVYKPNKDKQQVSEKQQNKENIPKHDNNQAQKDTKNHLPAENPPTKSKMWIRSKSAPIMRQCNPKKRNDPVSLYQEYQKDWEKFRNNICESSRSELRWAIREKLLANR